MKEAPIFTLKYILEFALKYNFLWTKKRQNIGTARVFFKKVHFFEQKNSHCVKNLVQALNSIYQKTSEFSYQLRPVLIILHFFKNISTFLGLVQKNRYFLKFSCRKKIDNLLLFFHAIDFLEWVFSFALRKYI